MQIILTPPPPPVESLLADMNDPKAKSRPDTAAAATKGKGAPRPCVHVCEDVGERLCAWLPVCACICVHTCVYGCVHL